MSYVREKLGVAREILMAPPGDCGRRRDLEAALNEVRSGMERFHPTDPELQAMKDELLVFLDTSDVPEVPIGELAQKLRRMSDEELSDFDRRFCERLNHVIDALNSRGDVY